MSDEQITAEATPNEELRRQILSQFVAKNEREWWASRTIEKLEFEQNAANNKIKQLETTIKELQEVNEYLRDKIEKLEYRRLDK